MKKRKILKAVKVPVPPRRRWVNFADRARAHNYKEKAHGVPMRPATPDQVPRDTKIWITLRNVCAIMQKQRGDVIRCMHPQTAQHKLNLLRHWGKAVEGVNIRKRRVGLLVRLWQINRLELLPYFAWPVPRLEQAVRLHLHIPAGTPVPWGYGGTRPPWLYLTRYKPGKQRKRSKEVVK